MGYNLLYTKNTIVCIIKWKLLQVEQAQSHPREDAFAKMEPTQLNAVKAIWLIKE
jgi:hypothetical protein